ncbi:hypothetical protein [Nostoc sp. CHAB 5715]|uniref:hypothetical protein n=1 Tax=Nostoc sp. CHAB 5715 TaxID=2780400 RepID=UPI001E4E07F1|nr:hypothetical protein [Nostoc sp. CHAB 5715]MCC5623095.1 hypothetical protein [Nostoc sp. CHAB 5715]
MPHAPCPLALSEAEGMPNDGHLLQAGKPSVEQWLPKSPCLFLQPTRSGYRLNGVYANVFTICHNKRTVTSLPGTCRQQNQPQLQVVDNDGCKLWRYTAIKSIWNE